MLTFALASTMPFLIEGCDSATIHDCGATMTKLALAAAFTCLFLCGLAFVARSEDVAPLRNSLYESLPVWNDDYFISSSEIKPGMTGVAKTVVFGATIDEFKVTVIQVGRDRGFNDHAMLFCRAEGWVVDLTGGIAGGMSGSPVYIDGRLAGAISGHWSNTDQKTCIVTPIDGMLPAWNPADTRFKPFELVPPGTTFDASAFIRELAYPQTRGAWGAAPDAKPDASEPVSSENEDTPDSVRIADIGSMLDSNGCAVARIYDFDATVAIDGAVFTSFAVALRPGATPPSAPGIVPMTLAAEPVVVTSANPALTAAFVEAMGANTEYEVSAALPIAQGDMVAMPAETINAFKGIVPDKILESWSYPANVRASALLEPGCVLGQRYIRGDLSSYGYGTLTYVDKNGNFLAYGHRAGRDGFTISPAANGFVYYVPASWQRAGKRAVCLETIGTVFQDRGGAIAGLFGAEPPWTPVTVVATDAETGERFNVSCEVLSAPEYFPAGAASVVAAAIAFPAQRGGEGTVDAGFAVDLGDAGEFRWHSVNLAYGALGACSAEVAAFLEQAMNGEGAMLEVKSVTATSTVSLKRRSLRIAEVVALSPDEFKKFVIPETGSWYAPATDGFDKVFPDVKCERIDRKEGTLAAKADSIGRIRLMIKLARWHSDAAMWQPAEITIPAAMRGKQVRLQVRGGGGFGSAADAGDASFEAAIGAARGHIEPMRSPVGKSKLDWLTDFVRAPRGQHLIIEVVYAGIPKDVGLSDRDDLPYSRGMITFDGVVIGYEAATLDFK